MDAPDQRTEAASRNADGTLEETAWEEWMEELWRDIGGEGGTA